MITINNNGIEAGTTFKEGTTKSMVLHPDVNYDKTAEPNYEKIGKAVCIILKESFMSLISCNSIQPVVDVQQEKEVLNAAQLCRRFPCLCYGNVKSRKWRKENDFPEIQPGGYGTTVTFPVEDVEEWIKNRSSRGAA